MKARVLLIVAALTLAAAPAASAEEVEITSSKVELAPGQVRGWAYYCPPSHPYLKAIRKGTVTYGVWRDLSSSSVTGSDNPFLTDWKAGKLAITFTNWNPFGSATQQIAFTCTDDFVAPTPV